MCRSSGYAVYPAFIRKGHTVMSIRRPCIVLLAALAAAAASVAVPSTAAGSPPGAVPTLESSELVTDAASSVGVANGWGAHGNRIARTANGNLYVTYVTDGADTDHFQWHLAELAHGSPTWHEIASGITNHQPGSPPHVLVQQNQVYVITVGTYDDATGGAPRIWDSATDSSTVIPGRWLTGDNLRRAGATYSAASIDRAGNIYFQEDVPCPFFVNLDGSSPACHSNNSPGTYYLSRRDENGVWQEQTWSSDYRDGYNFILPTPSGSIQQVGTRDIQEAPYEAPYTCPNGTGYCYDQVRDYVWPTPDGPPSSPPVVLAASSATEYNGDHYAAAEDGYTDTIGRVHALYTQIDASDNMNYPMYNRTVVQHADGSLHYAIINIPYVNLARLVQDTTGRFWVYSVGPAGDGQCTVFIQGGAADDTDGTVFDPPTSITIPGGYDCWSAVRNFDAAPRNGSRLTNTIDGVVMANYSADVLHYRIRLPVSDGE
jgi:hypothetical protein